MRLLLWEGAALPNSQADSRPLDDLDLAILKALGVDARLTNKALATRLGVAESTCAFRVRALRDSGVIAGTDIRLDLAALGFPIQAIVKVRLGSHDLPRVASLYDDLAATPGVLQVFHVAGADDFHLHVAVSSPEELRDLVLEHVTIHPVVRQTETQLVFGSRPGAGVLSS